MKLVHPENQHTIIYSLFKNIKIPQKKKEKMQKNMKAIEEEKPLILHKQRNLFEYAESQLLKTFSGKNAHFRLMVTGKMRKICP